MITAKNFINFLKKSGIDYFTGVPDSLLNELIVYLQNQKRIYHDVASNEGSAIALGTGYHLATGKIPFIYMQNSGLCNALNPILTLVDETVYSIPQLILVGRRGAPGTKDEPQHTKIGSKTISLLDSLNLKNIDLSNLASETQVYKLVARAIKFAREKNKPIFLIINKNFFIKESFKKVNIKKEYTKRIEYIEQLIISKKFQNSKFFSTTGFASRELYYLNNLYKKGHGNSFYNIGAMGHVSQIAYVFKKFYKSKKNNVIIIDGDGSLQMQMGNILSIGKTSDKILHIVFNNCVHESTGGHYLASNKLDYNLLFKACGYKRIKTIKNLNQFIIEIRKPIKFTTALIINVLPGSINNLPRPDLTTLQLKKVFLKKRKV